ncbi:MarR family winged helix-turn-helix transcriptional regulator [Actinopolymorpha pittospori]
MDEPRWLNEQEARVWRGYIDLRRDLSSLLERQMLRDDGLSAAEFALLVPLSESEEGVLRARDLGLAVGWERSRLSHQVSRMEKRGLLVRENCDEDARGSMVRLTDAGRAAIVAAAPAHVEAVRRYFFDVLTQDDLQALEAIFGRVLAGLPKALAEECRED